MRYNSLWFGIYKWPNKNPSFRTWLQAILQDITKSFHCFCENQEYYMELCLLHSL